MESKEDFRNNIYAQLGFECPEAMSKKANIMARIAEVLREKNIDSARQAAIPDVDWFLLNSFLAGHFHEADEDELIRLLEVINSIEDV